MVPHIFHFIPVNDKPDLKDKQESTEIKSKDIKSKHLIEETHKQFEMNDFLQEPEFVDCGDPEVQHILET